jgi:hypothetical protein
MISAVERDESVSDRISYIKLEGRWCHIIVLNAHAPTENKTDAVKDSFHEELEECSLIHNVHTDSRAQPATYPLALSPGVKRQVREANHSPPTSAEAKKTWIYTSTPPYVFIA